jgi:mxaL protein
VTFPVLRFDGIAVIDITQSMNAQDYAIDGRPVSRLAAARQTLHAVLQALPCGSRLGFGVFTEYRTMVLIAPLEVCANFRELTSVLDRIDGRMAWAGRSEVAKGIYGAITSARALSGKPAVVFFTDGHEAPPVHPGHRPRFNGEPGEIAGLLVGVGGRVPVPIPKLDPDGRQLGFWRADEVMQLDPYSRGRGGSVSNERMAETEPVQIPQGWPIAGNEHLSRLDEGYLKLLARELSVDYLRLDASGLNGRAVAQRMDARPLARRTPTRLSMRPLLGVVALMALAWAFGGAAWMGAWANRRVPSSSTRRLARRFWRPARQE